MSIANGANVNDIDWNGFAPIHYAAKNGKFLFEQRFLH